MRTQDLIALLAVVIGGCAMPIALQYMSGRREREREFRQEARDARRDALELARQQAQFEEAKWADVRAVTEEAAITLNAALRAFDEATAGSALARDESIALFQRFKSGIYDLWRCHTRLVTRLPRNYELVQLFGATASAVESGMLPLSALALARAEAHEGGIEFARAEVDPDLTRAQRDTYRIAVEYAEEFHDAARALIGPAFGAKAGDGEELLTSAT